MVLFEEDILCNIILTILVLSCVLYKFHVINNNGTISLVHASRKIGGNIGYPVGMRNMKYYDTQNSIHQHHNM